MTDQLRQADLFAHEAPRQTALLDEPVCEPPRPVHTKESIRALLTGLIDGDRLLAEFRAELARLQPPSSAG